MTTLHLRLDPGQQASLQFAADASCKTLSGFVLDSAIEAAEQLLRGQDHFTVDDTQSRALLGLLDRPAQDNAGLQDLFARRAPWED